MTEQVKPPFAAHRVAVDPVRPGEPSVQMSNPRAGTWHDRAGVAG